MELTSHVSERIARIQAKASARVRLGTCLSEGEVRSFEERHQVLLPEGYRTFLLQVGNGGTGPPDGGLQKLGVVASDMDSEQLQTFTELPFVGRPFPFTKAWCWEDGDRSDEGTREQTQHGCINIGNDGCGQYLFLIVTGKERGNVWMTCGVGTTPTVPKRDFLQWYEDWLDGERNWFG